MTKDKKAALAFAKEQFFISKRFTPIQKDVLQVLLQDGELYTLEQAQQMLEQFSNRMVKE